MADRKETLNTLLVVAGLCVFVLESIPDYQNDYLVRAAGIAICTVFAAQYSARALLLFQSLRLWYHFESLRTLRDVALSKRREMTGCCGFLLKQTSVTAN